ncbi:3-hydroxyacyl-CoA dehydrogenase family protein, partial [Parvimonas sp. D9]|nr:3-hydroxyacyl-CoA dehydrogenase family protein [Parvimonas sp. D9]
VWEIVPAKEVSVTTQVLEAMGFAYQFVPDVPGMVAARVIAMIINEAFFALGDGISSKHDIDTVMKLGTNYPYGPFEWCNLIG